MYTAGESVNAIGFNYMYMHIKNDIKNNVYQNMICM